ncbi:hypothetical protein WR25_05087 [Diploscapter pachys]|uniref:Uncharacterized protein n=1 Tax=Diploscapter pachys TaxID=2018661 RepID=A0A2A2M3T5_9BILA|nr:hypothetical protein WR25_05087 [Diploscapter pachys]
MAAEHRQPRLFLGGDDVEVDAGFRERARDEILPVARPPARFGRDRARERDVAALQLVGADAQRGDGAFDRGVAQPAGRGEAFAEAHDARKGVDDGEAIALRPGDQQPAIVGAEVERGKGLRIGPATALRSARRRTGRRGLPVRHSGGTIPHSRGDFLSVSVLPSRG